jgi:dolichyl-phosphate-mannose--protein O-mannosyl transferase
MKAYVITTGTVFGLLTIAHLLRMVMEKPDLASEPFYLAITAASAALCVWAFVVLRRSRQP